MSERKWWEPKPTEALAPSPYVYKFYNPKSHDRSRTVTVVNRRAERRRAGVWVDRRSPLGNPYFEGRDGTREEVVQKYYTWLRWAYKHNKEARKELERLAAYEEPLTLLCWCDPLPCHAHVIAKAIDGIRTQQKEAVKHATR